jgi:hypothetical protein
MSRSIDWSKPLSDEDRAWAEQRWDMPAGQGGMSVGQMIAANDEEHGKAAKDAKKSRSEQIQEANAQIAELENKISRLQAEQAEEDRVNAAFSGSEDDRARGLGYVDNTAVDGETPAGAPTSVEQYTDKRWTADALKDEISKRNEDRVRDGLEAMPLTGTKAELIERLQKDDEELAQAGE